jgi:hypothetical protein
MLHGKTNAGRPIKNVLYWLRETQRVTAQILKDVDREYGAYLTTASYTMEYWRKGYEEMSWIKPSHNMVEWWAFVISDEPAVRMSYRIEL